MSRLACGRLSVCGDAAEFSAAEDQRLALSATQGDHLAEHDLVITALMAGRDPAFDMGQGVLYEWGSR